MWVQRVGDGEAVEMSSATKEELLLLIIFAPCMNTNLRAGWLDMIFTTDASPFAAAFAVRRSPRKLHLSFWGMPTTKAFILPFVPQLSAYLDKFAHLAPSDRL